MPDCTHTLTQADGVTDEPDLKKAEIEELDDNLFKHIKKALLGATNECIKVFRQH